MKKFTFPIIALRVLISFLFIFGYYQAHNQTSQDSAYLPQVNISALYGFGPYIIGTEQDNVITIDSLPENTGKVSFRFIDIDSIQIGDAHNVEGQSLESAYWHIYLDSLHLPLSPRLHVKVDYGTDSTANYFIAYTVYPDTLEVNASEGWGPFFTNNYNLNDTLWQPVPELNNTFKVKNLPPRTSEVAFYISLLDSTVVDSLHVYGWKKEHLDSASFPNVKMDSLSLHTGFLKIVVKCNGGPDKGWSTFHTLKVRPQLPILEVTSDDGITLIDSVKPAFQNQLSGHSLLVDSIKYMATTNFPGGQRYSRQGSYSLNLAKSQYSIEAWIKPNIDMLKSGRIGEMTFMKVDSAWSLSIAYSAYGIRFKLNSLFNDSLRNLAYADVSFSTILASEWHHISLVSYETMDKKFYLNGFLIPTQVNVQIIGFLVNSNDSVVKALKTQALLMGGCNSENKKTTSDLTFINAMDEVRIWNKALTAEEIYNIYGKTIMQEPELIGYWNFDDLNCEGNVVDDISYRCNNAQLYNGATLIPQHPGIQLSFDKLHFISSNNDTYPVKYYFIDDVNNVIDSGVAVSGTGIYDIYYDIQALPTNTDILRIDEIVAGSDIAFSTDYKLTILPPKPIATSRTGWGIFCASSDVGIPAISDTGILFNPVSISSLPVNTKKIIAGWEKDGELFDTKSFTSSSHPWEHSLTLNGIDNYIMAKEYSTNSFSTFTIMFWFKTNTTKGGEMLGYALASSVTGGKSRHDHGTYIKMKTDGAIQFILPVGNGDSTVSLNASNKFNDGKWHHLAACYDGKYSPKASLYIDGTLTDETDVENVANPQLRFFMGRNHESKAGSDAVAEYFQGSFSEVYIWRRVLDYKSINRNMYRTVSPIGIEDVARYYKLNERQGDLIHDASEANRDADLYGSDKMWSYQNEMSCVTWTDNLLDYPEGEYNFFVRAYCEASPDTGIYYNPLGRIKINNPVEGFDVTYNFEQGTGYFDEGTIVKNNFNFWTNYNNPGCKYNIISLYIIDPKGHCLYSLINPYSNNTTQFSHSIDMGGIITGSYLKLNYGYEDYSANIYIDTFNIIPLFTRSILPPVVSGNFGPFDQAIAPGTMEQINTIYIKTEDYDDLKVRVSLYAYNGECIVDTAATKINNTSWHFVYNMATLPPPYVNMKIRYYLGDDTDPVVTQGPFHIIIHRTRPRWFDFLPDENFSDIVENGEEVTFKMRSTIEDKFEDFISVLSIPSSVPFFGGLSAHIKSAEIVSPLRYVVPDYKLHLTDTLPTFKQSFINLGSDAQTVLKTTINTSGSKFYLHPVTNDIITSYNMHWDGKISSKLGKAAEVFERIKSILDIAEDIEIGVTPTFDISYTGNYQFSRRLNLITDSLTGKWGSHGNLKVNANPASPDYNKSASFHFYGGTFGLEFTIGAKVGAGFVEADFCLDARFPIGFGQSYKSIPEFETHFLKSFGFQTYGKAVIKIFWGWYEETIWGPKMFYSTNIWGNDMKDCFPAPDKKQEKAIIKANSSFPELADAIVSISRFNKTPLAYPEVSIATSEKFKLFTWVERGKKFGERQIKASLMNSDEKKFLPTSTIEVNNHAINSLMSDAISNTEILVCWAQTHYDNLTFPQIKADNIIHSFLESQDIWFASYDIQTDSLLQMEKVTTTGENPKEGIAKANPIIVRLSDDKAIIIWQVAEFELNTSHIWYALLNKTNGSWLVETPEPLATLYGIQTDLTIATPAENQALLVWLNTVNGNSTTNRIMSMVYDGTEWTEPGILLDEANEHYNYYDLSLKNNAGGLVVTAYVSKPDEPNHEKISFIPWDESIPGLNITKSELILMDSVFHIQNPELTLYDDQQACIAVKREKIIPKDSLSKVSQIDLFIKNIEIQSGVWEHLPLSEFVCDTTKQVSEIEITYIGKDTLIMFTHEYPLTASNSKFKPVNGVIFADPYMNIVLRSFMIDEDSIIDIPEEEFFMSVYEPEEQEQAIKLYQNYPNPCTDHTRIAFDIPEKMHIKLDLYDMKGYKTATLADQELVEGRYEILLNTGVLKSGTYIYTLTTKNCKLSSRMIVMN